MADQPPSLLADVKEHLQNLNNDSTIPLDDRLLEKFQTQLTGENVGHLIPGFLPSLLDTLSTLKQNPDPLVAVIQRLFEPLSFIDAFNYVKEPATLAEALRSPVSSVNVLAVTILHKASGSGSDAAIVAGMKEVMRELVTAYLLHETEASVQIASTLEALLKTDHKRSVSEGLDVDIGGVSESYQSSPGQGLMWRRLFGDKDIYRLFYALTSLNTKELGDLEMSKKQKTVAQSRLLAMIPPIAKIDIAPLLSSHFPDVENSYGAAGGQSGLLDYATLHMVDTKDDVLMHMTFIDFLTELLKATPAQPPLSSPLPTLPKSTPESAPLDFVISRGIHARTSNFYLNPDSPSVDPLDASFLSSRSAHYLATYASLYPHHLLAARVPDGEETVVQRLLKRLRQAMEKSTHSHAQGPPAHDLHLLASIPRSALLSSLIASPEQNARFTWQDNPISRIPYRVTHEDYLKTLGAIFHGSDSVAREIMFPSSSNSADQADPDVESAAARAIYILYIDHNPDFFWALVRSAETIALKETALAALALLTAIITAKWAPLPSSSHDSDGLLPTNEQLMSQILPAARFSMPSTGVEALLLPPALDTVIPYLCSPPQTFTNLVGGRGDVESAAYKVAIAKYDALKRLHEGLKEHGESSSVVQAVKRNVNLAVGRGPWGNEGGIGGHIGTLEL
ncbi:MAG: hypothetical protein M1833_000805 [Piccolia ochrophora]|nr:MAG: hypothetical protein M1833_000805 [Piccolia ochrophora]